MSASRPLYNFTVIFALMLAQPALAADLAADGDASSSNVPIYSGGVGEEMDHIREVEHQYDLKVMFTEASGAYLADLPVTIKDKQGKTIVSTVTNGPILLVNLPTGNYTVSAADGSVTKDQKVALTSGSLRIVQIRFPTHENEIPRSGE